MAKCVASARKPLEIRLLGELELRRGGTPIPLPQSRKTRALLAYLVVSGRSQRRERLCAMFWDVADDPRAALRWSLSRLRPAVDEDGAKRLIADRETVRFDPAGARIDFDDVRERLADAKTQESTAVLMDLAAEFRGEFLEGLELPEFDDFQAWCVAQREEARRLHVSVLRSLLDRLRDDPEAALEHARALVQAGPFDAEARGELIRLLGRCGRRREAQQQAEIGRRVQREIGASAASIEEAWNEIRDAGVATSANRPQDREPEFAAIPPPPAPCASSDERDEWVGRDRSWNDVLRVLADVERHRAQVVLVTGEPGVGKSRLLAELAHEVQRHEGTVLEACAYEAERSRPYGPWIDALRRLPAVAVGTTLGAELAPLLPELRCDAGVIESRDRLFGAIVELVAARCHSAPPVLLLVDDAQWVDAASTELLHYVVRMSRHRPLLVALSARAGELPDNEPLQRMLRGLRHERLIEEIELGPLDRAATERLVRRIAPEADVGQIFEQSNGNPLFVRELARETARSSAPLPSSLRQLVRDRLARLPTDAGELLSWGAVLGRVFDVDLIAALTSFDLERLVATFEILERHALLRSMSRPRGGAGYGFAHDLVRQVVYAEISEPRRRLMHRRVSQELAKQAASDESLASDVARHAAHGGDEAMAADACVAAGRRCLRLFANRDAEALANRGLRHAEKLPEPERVKRILELCEIRFAARRPDDGDAAARQLEALAERALDFGCAEHARLGFHLLSYLRWETGAWSDARRQMMRAEQASRAGDDAARVLAMAEAARCLTMLERDLPSAEALLLEARALSARLALEPVAIPDAEGMLRLHQGRVDEAEALFARAHDLARRAQDRRSEFHALEHLVAVALQRRDFGVAVERSTELCRIAQRLREGSEAPFAAGLAAVSRYATDAGTAAEDLEASLRGLREADAKHRLAYVLLRAAEADLERGAVALASERAQEALNAALTLDRPTEMAQARAILARSALADGERKVALRHLAEIDSTALRGVAEEARRVVDRLKLEIETRTA